jgi:pimeloyl-ACP methyl ester carboxylesterase
VVPAGEQLVNRTPARVVLDLHSYRPGRHADQIDAPVHVVVAENDRLLPLAATERLLDHLPDPHVHRIPARHFDVHHEPWFEPVVDEQVAFLADATSPDP